MKMLHGTIIAALLCTTTNVLAQQYPTRSIEMIIPFSAGGGVDSTGRRIARAMSAHLGKPIVVTNRDGASGSIGFGTLSDAKPDGYVTGGGPTTPIANAIHLLKSVHYTLDSFDYICRTFDNVFVLAVPADSKFKTAQDLFAEAKAEPGKINFGHAGVSSNSHLSMENLADGLKLKMQPVAFRGDSPMLPEILAGRLDAAAISLPAVRDQALRVLVVFADERIPSFPDTPTARELGVRHVPTMNGVFAPKGLPTEVKTALEKACDAAMKDAEVREFVLKSGQVPNYKDSAGFKADVETDFRIKGELIKTIGLVLN